MFPSLFSLSSHRCAAHIPHEEVPDYISMRLSNFFDPHFPLSGRETSQDRIRPGGRVMS
jgi:hypothetical protein